MVQENKNLLLQDLCGRIPYGIKVFVDQSQLQNYDSKWKNWEFEEEPQELDGVSIYGVTFGCMDMNDGVIGFEFIKPYLFPLSSMTEEQCEKFKIISGWDGEWEDIKRGKFSCIGYIGLDYIYDTIDWLNKNHFDFRGLIEKGLAIDATGLNIY